MTMRFKGRHVIVTGAASGIGLATVKRLLQEGATVTAVDLAGFESDHPAICNPAVRFLALDVRDGDAAQRVVAGTVKEFGRIDALITAAGISFGLMAHETGEDQWKTTLDVNVTGTFLWARACLPVMRRAGKGNIVTVASQRALAGGTASASYVASKGAVLSFTRSLAVDYASDGLRANAVLPGAIRTPMLEKSFSRTADGQDVKRRSLERHPMHRFGEPHEVAATIAFLASDEASFITGVFLPVDGGWLAG